jgi:hypothetical protein
MMRAMQSDPNMAKMPYGFMFFGGLIGAVFGLAWGWAYPIFLLIWLHRPVIKQETATWQ